MKSIRCILGWHDFKEIDTEEVDVAFGGAVKGYVNAECSRCKRKEWFNWPIKQ